MNIILSDYTKRLVNDLKGDKKYRFCLTYNPPGDYYNIIIYYPTEVKQPTVITIPGDCEFRNYREFLLIIRNKLRECLL